MPYIFDCGELPLTEPYDLTQKQLGDDGDIKPELNKVIAKKLIN
jgi:hypothetical protein